MVDPFANVMFTKAMQVPEVKAKLVVQELYPIGICGTDFGAYGGPLREIKSGVRVESATPQ